AGRRVIVEGRGGTRSAGKLNCPLSLLTTVVVMVEPSFLALTSTPSIAPSSVDETWPLSAAAVWAWAGAKVSHASALTRLVDASRALKRMIISLAGLFHCEMNCPHGCIF